MQLKNVATKLLSGDTFISGCNRKNTLDLDMKVITIMVTAILSMIMITYLSDPKYLNILLRWILHMNYYITDIPLIYRISWWVSINVVFYLLIPMGIVMFLFQEKLNKYGLTVRNNLKHSKPYVILLLVMIPFILLAIRFDDFKRVYPYYGKMNTVFSYKIVLFEIMYLIQFFCMEFFFRGFLVHGLANRFGYYSVFIMVMPYSMMHFGKPIIECLGSIVAGIVLGLLSFRNKSFIPGLILHYSVAMVMELSAILTA